MSLLTAADSRPVHFVGVAGAGMSALAELLARRGATVSGCDAHAEHVEDLRRLGITIVQGHDPAHVAGARALVVTSAMPKDHPELVAARDAGLPVIRRAEALAEATAGGTLVGIAGTHGKTTTTVLTTEALDAAGLAPTGVAGGRVGSWGGNLRFGGEGLFVVEADEYDRSFLALTPTVAVVNNVEADHLDIYRDLDDIRGAFTEFARRARYVVASADDAVASALPYAASSEVVRVGIARDGRESGDARLLARDLRQERGGTRFAVTFDGDDLGELTLRVPGEHNVRNALAAIGVGLVLGTTLDRMRAGLESFGGVERRFQRLGRAAASTSSTTTRTTRRRSTRRSPRRAPAYPDRRIVAAFQPHLFTRTRDFANEFARALAAADAVYLTEIYPAREQPIAGVSADLIADAAHALGRPVTWRGDRRALADALAADAARGDVVLTLGAGDITLTGPELLGRLRAEDGAEGDA